MRRPEQSDTNKVCRLHERSQDYAQREGQSDPFGRSLRQARVKSEAVQLTLRGQEMHFILKSTTWHMVSGSSHLSKAHRPKARAIRHAESLQRVAPAKLKSWHLFWMWALSCHLFSMPSCDKLVLGCAAACNTEVSLISFVWSYFSANTLWSLKH